jgi:hypothetical protein
MELTVVLPCLNDEETVAVADSVGYWLIPLPLVCEDAHFSRCALLNSPPRRLLAAGCCCSAFRPL